MNKPRIGAQLFTLRDYTETIVGVENTFEKVRAAGYTGVQISAFGPVDPGAVARLARQHDIFIAATHFAWEEFVTELDRIIDIHQLWGCRHAAIGGLPSEYFDAGGLARFADELAPVAEQLTAAGIDFSYHNHNHELARHGDSTWLSKLYQTIPGETLKAEIDVYWLVAGGADPIQWIRDLADRQEIIHFKDMAVLPDRSQRFAEVGEGNLNWSGIVRESCETDIEWIFVEQDDCYGNNPFDCLATSYRNLSRMGLV